MPSKERPMGPTSSLSQDMVIECIDRPCQYLRLLFRELLITNHRLLNLRKRFALWRRAGHCLTFPLPVQLKIEESSRKLRSGDLGIAANQDDRLLTAAGKEEQAKRFPYSDFLCFVKATQSEFGRVSNRSLEGDLLGNFAWLWILITTQKIILVFGLYILGYMKLRGLIGLIIIDCPLSKTQIGIQVGRGCNCHK